MLTEKGLVTKVENGIAWVNTRSKLACASCQVESTCGNGILEKYLADKVFVSHVENSIGASVGDEVTIAIPKNSLTRAAMITYFFPVLLLFLGALLGNYWFENELGSVTIGLSAFVLSFILIKSFSKKILNSRQYQPQLLDKKSQGYDASQFDAIKVKNI